MRSHGTAKARRGGGWGRCKRWCTVGFATLCLVVFACGGAQKSGNHYQKTVDKQRSCCSQLADPSERARCIDQIVTVDDPDVASSPENQATFRCMDDNFVCDASTGQATSESKQAQLDCLNDL